MGTLQFTELLQKDKELQGRVWLYQHFNCPYIFVSIQVILHTLLTLWQVLLCWGRDRRTASLLKAGLLPYHRNSQVHSPQDIQEHVGAKPGLPVAPPMNKMGVSVPSLTLCVHPAGMAENLRPEQHVSPMVCVQKPGVIKHAFMSRIFPPVRKKEREREKKSSLREENSKDTARCFHS